MNQAANNTSEFKTCRVAPGITPLGLPQIRTCRIPASGSSSQVRAEWR